MPVPSQGHYGFHSFPVVDWFCLFIYLRVLTFPLLDCSEFGNFVITLIKQLIEMIIMNDIFIRQRTQKLQVDRKMHYNSDKWGILRIWPSSLFVHIKNSYYMIYHVIFYIHFSNKAIETDMPVLIRSQQCCLYDQPKKINK